GRPPGAPRGEERREQHVLGRNRRDRLDTWRRCTEALRLPPLAEKGDAAVLGRDDHVARAELGDSLEPELEVLVVVELLPDERLRLRLPRADEERLRLDGEPQRLTLAGDHRRHVTARELVDDVGVEAVLDVARQRPGQDDELRALREVAQLLAQRLEL